MLSTTSEHALRALVELALLPQRETVLGKDLARRARIPANYLSKILWMLARAGIIYATRGNGGGYRLRKRPDKIRLVDVVELFDGTRAKPMCLLGAKSACSDANPCSAHETWREVRAAYVRFLDTTTLAQIAAKASG